MLCPQHMLCEMVSFSTSNSSHIKCYPERTHTLIYSQLWLLCLLMLVGFLQPYAHPRHTHAHRNHQGEERMKRPSRWLITDPWLSFEKLSFQIKLSSLKGQRCHSGAPGHSPSSLEGLTCIFLSCQRCVMGGGEAKQKRIEVIPLTNIDSLKYLMGLWKKLKWLKLPNAQIRTQVI